MFDSRLKSKIKCCELYACAVQGDSNASQRRHASRAPSPSENREYGDGLKLRKVSLSRTHMPIL
jgi:hypothetical protein